VIHDGNSMLYDPIQGQGQGQGQCAKMADLKGYLHRQYACNQKTQLIMIPKTISEFLLDRFLIFILVRHHVTVKLRVFHLWQTNFASYKELTLN